MKRKVSSLLFGSLAIIALCASMQACSSGDSGAVPGAGGEGGAGGQTSTSDGYLVVVTERESPETSLHYLHVVRDWPENRELDYSEALELGAFPNVLAQNDAVFVQLPEDGSVRKLAFDRDGKVVSDATISFAAQGVTNSGDLVYASSDRAYYVDEAAGLIVVWNPEELVIVETVDIDEALLSRDGLVAQVSRGPVVDGEGFVSFSWRDWGTLAYHDAAAMGVFDATSDEPELEVIEDDRCASTVTVPFDGGDGFVYLVSDAALGFDALANPTRTEKALCVLRIRPGAREFDDAFLVDLSEALESPGFYAVHPMKDGRLLVNVWSPDVDVADVADPDDPGWYWGGPPYFEFAVVDLSTGSSTKVESIDRAAVQWSVTLRVDDDTFVQTYRGDGGSDLFLVDTDASTTRVLSNGQGTDVQYLGRIRP